MILPKILKKQLDSSSSGMKKLVTSILAAAALTISATAVASTSTPLTNFEAPLLMVQSVGVDGASWHSSHYSHSSHRSHSSHYSSRW